MSNFIKFIFDKIYLFPFIQVKMNYFRNFFEELPTEINNERQQILKKMVEKF